jgi:hypothetical protein
VPDATLEQIGRTVRVFRATTAAVDAYRPAPYDGDVLLLEAAEGSARAAARIAPATSLRRGAGGHRPAAPANHPGHARGDVLRAQRGRGRAGGGGGTGLWVLLAIHVALLVGAVAGLALLRRWGYWCVYLLVPFSTILLSISLIPHLPRPFPPELRPWVLAAANLAVLAAAVFAHAGTRAHARRRGAG